MNQHHINRLIQVEVQFVDWTKTKDLKHDSKYENFSHRKCKFTLNYDDHISHLLTLCRVPKPATTKYDRVK